MMHRRGHHLNGDFFKRLVFSDIVIGFGSFVLPDEEEGAETKWRGIPLAQVVFLRGSFLEALGSLEVYNLDSRTLTPCSYPLLRILYG